MACTVVAAPLEQVLGTPYVALDRLLLAPRASERRLRGCVKRLTGRKHWCPACEKTEAWVLELIRGWYAQEAPAKPPALIVR